MFLFQPGFVEAVAVSTGQKQMVPAHWLDEDSPFVDQFTQTPSAKQLEARSETPDDTWTVKQLREHATQAGIDLAGANTKADVLSALNDAPKSGEED